MVAARKLRAVLALLGDDARLRDQVLTRIGLTAADLADEESLVSQNAWRDVWVAVVEALGDPSIGLRAGQRVDRGYFGVIDYLVRTSGDVAQALVAAQRFFALVNTHGHLEIVREGDEVAVVRHVVGDEGGLLPPQAAEFAMASMVALLRDATTLPWSLTRATFRHPEPAYAHAHRQFFACPLRFGATVDSLVVDADLLATPMAAPDEPLRRLVERHAEVLLRERAPDGTVVDDVRRVLARELAGARSGAEHVAQLLGLSRSGLQRQLREASTSFREVRDDLRRDLAHRYLVDANMTVGEVAALLGYSEPSAFHRAFKAWHAEGPGQYRARHRAEGPCPEVSIR